MRSNIWDQPEPEDVGPIDYHELRAVVSFDDFDYGEYLRDERRVLQPQIEALGYRVQCWMDQPHNYLAHATARVCKCIYPDGSVRWFIYD